MLTARVRKRLPDYTLDIDFTFDQGTLVVCGPSGAGKTTLLDCLAGLTRPDEGHIEFDGRDLYDSATGVNVPPRLRRIGYVFQDYALFPHLTVGQNLRYGLPGNVRAGGEDILKAFGLAHLTNRYPSQLSGGEKQRLALARSLVARPKLLLLDEPWSALDEETRDAVRSEVLEAQRSWDIPFILVTHDRQEAKAIGQAVMSLDRGRAAWL
ncbi:MAG TPA: ATP-binding cassette domain-containing protein [Bacillota bacterium]|jgi:molybdate transport system ATP-binding protein